ncbi:MAG: hypothetical protein H0T18_09155, partial [Chloroflexia bacterium]|nr:hypothetical protein [Chloroflexia bacterium]
MTRYDAWTASQETAPAVRNDLLAPPVEDLWGQTQGNTSRDARTMSDAIPFIPYPPIGAHGVIGDRRTAALVAADGTLDWFCLPIYDGQPLFASLLDARQGGFWRAGPERPCLGHGRYIADSAVLVTRWNTPSG